MSGGSYDYAFRHIEDLAEYIRERATDPKRRAFADLLDLCATAARDIEWVDSGDTSPGAETKAIEAALSFNAGAAMAIALRQDLQGAIEQAETYLNSLHSKDGDEL